jgi:nucleoside-diphosphate-sugar epimerase
MKYLVTGGAGFIGSALVKRLAERGDQVTVLDDMSRGQPERLNGVPCQIRHGDVRSMYDVLMAIHGVDTVIHLAYLQGTQTFYSEPREVLDVAVRGMTNILTACAQSGVSDLMLMSSSEAYQVAPVVPTPEDVPLTVPDPLNPRYSYGGGKIACELMSLAWARTGVLDRCTIVRPHNIYGPDMGREHVIPEFCLRMNELAVRPEYNGTETVTQPIPFPIQGTGEETRSFCWIGDCVAQLELLLNRASGSSIYHVGTMDERSIRAVAYQVAGAYNRTVKIIPGSLPKGSPPRRLPDTRKIRELHGSPLPSTPFSEGVRLTAEWYKTHG